MKVLLEIKDSKADFVLELLKSLSYVKAKPIRSEKDEILLGLIDSVKEVKLAKKGKAKLKSFDDFLNEL